VLVPIIACVFAAWVVLSILLAIAIGRAAHQGEVEYQDQVFLRQLAREASLNTSAIDALLTTKV
jgi:hypothetical protein